MPDWYPMLGVILGSGALSAVITSLFNRRKTGADATATLADAALKLEERASTRYDSATRALLAAENALRVARLEICALQDERDYLHDLLDRHDISYRTEITVID